MIKSVSTSVAQFQSFRVSDQEPIQTIMNHFIALPSCLLSEIFNQWIELKDVARLDSALCDKTMRPTFLNLLSSAECIVETERENSSNTFLSWLLIRAVKVRYFYISRDVDEELGVQYMKKHGSLVTKIVRERVYSQGGKSKDFGLKIVKQAFNHGNLVSLKCYNLSAASLDEILSRCESVRELRVGMSFEARSAQTVNHHVLLPSISDLYVSGNQDNALSVISLCPNLRKLSLCAHIADPCVAKMAEKCRHLKFLCLRGVRSTEFTAVATLCTDIVNLDLSFTAVTDDAMEGVAENLKHLRRLNIQRCVALTNASLQSLAHHRVATLEALWLSGSYRITSEAVLILKSQIPALDVHYQLSLNPERLKPADFIVCTVLIVYDLVHVLPIAAQFQALTVLCCCTGTRNSPVEIDYASMTEVTRRLPSLHTVGTYERNLLPLQSALNSLARKIRVTCNSACLSVDLHDFPV